MGFRVGVNLGGFSIWVSRRAGGSEFRPSDIIKTVSVRLLRVQG